MTWYIAQCRGCDYVFVAAVSTNSEDWELVERPDGEQEQVFNETVRYYPALSKRKRPDWMGPLGIIEVTE